MYVMVFSGKKISVDTMHKFESLGPPCFPEFQDCPVQFDECNIAWRDRGAGSVETEGPLREILFSHKDEWRALNCSMFSGEPKGKAVSFGTSFAVGNRWI